MEIQGFWNVYTTTLQFLFPIFVRFQSKQTWKQLMLLLVLPVQSKRFSDFQSLSLASQAKPDSCEGLGRIWDGFSANISVTVLLFNEENSCTSRCFLLSFPCFCWLSCVPFQPQTFPCLSFFRQWNELLSPFLELKTFDVSRWTDTQSLFHQPHMKRKRH